MRVKLFFAIILVFSFFNMNAQSSFGLFGEAGVNKDQVSCNEPRTADFQLSSSMVFSSKQGVDYNLLLKDKIVIGAKALYLASGNKIASRNVFQYTNGTSLTLVRSCRYREGGFGFNPYVGFRHNKYSLNIGMQFLRIFWTSDKFATFENGILSYSGHFFNRGYVTRDWGYTANLTYHLNNSFSLQADYYYGKSDLFSHLSYDSHVYLTLSRQLTIGLNYSLWVLRKMKK